jgi:hypothetical protein
MPKRKLSVALKKQHILDNTDDLEFSERKCILRMIYNSKSSKFLKEKGNGTQINLDKLPIKLICSIYDYIISLEDKNDE